MGISMKMKKKRQYVSVIVTGVDFEKFKVNFARPEVTDKGVVPSKGWRGTGSLAAWVGKLGRIPIVGERIDNVAKWDSGNYEPDFRMKFDQLEKEGYRILENIIQAN